MCILRYCKFIYFIILHIFFTWAYWTLFYFIVRKIRHNNFIQLKFTKPLYTNLISNNNNKINSHAIVCHQKTSCQKHDQSTNYLQLDLRVFHRWKTWEIRTRKNTLSRNQVIRYINAGSMIHRKLLKILKNPTEPKLTAFIMSKNKFMTFSLTQEKDSINQNKIRPNSNKTSNATKEKNKC